MKRFNLYILTMLFSALVLVGVIHFGPKNFSNNISHQPTFDLLSQEIALNLSSPIAGLFTQILIILLFSRVCGFILKYFGQPQVIGEMIAGILLGRSVLEFFAPTIFETIFPSHSMPQLYLLSQLGLVSFMFVVGLELKLSNLKQQASTALLVSHVSIVFPFILGAVASLFLYENFGPKDWAFSSFMLFMGISMSITAFPVLARILQERNLSQTHIGAMALTCAAIDDVTAWCILSAVLGFVKAGTVIVAATIFLVTALYIFLMVKIVKPYLASNLKNAQGSGHFSNFQLALIFFTMIFSAFISEAIGIHALFGAFLAGTLMPTDLKLRESLIDKIESFSSVLLLPIFFAYTGIRTQINLIHGLNDWLVCLGIITLAITGKLLGSAVAARFSGLKWRESWALGALMNTRGLMELIVLNIGYDLGILPPKIFSMMVVMAIVTTLMTSPLLKMILREKLVGQS